MIWRSAVNEQNEIIEDLVLIHDVNILLLTLILLCNAVVVKSTLADSNIIIIQQPKN